MKIVLKLLFLGILLGCKPTYALWNQQHEEGWHWYQDPAEEQKNPSKNSQQNMKALDPLEEITAVQKNLERLRAEAILRPSEPSVKAYIEKQVWASNQADRFSQVWDAVMRLHPELDYSTKYPTAQFARHIYLDQQKANINQAIEQFKTQYGFFFFFKGDCPYCHALAPVINALSTNHGIHTTAVSLDGGPVAEYPNPRPDNGISNAMQVHAVPALFAVNPVTNDWFPIVTGAISQTDLEERILAIAEYLAFDKDESNDATLTPNLTSEAGDMSCRK
jgi:conjugal transfer pilus assembly protein TraF